MDADSPQSARTFIYRHRYTLMWVGLVAVLIIAQLPGLFARDPQQTIAWRSMTFESALAEARRDDKLVLLNFTADWCPPCQRMKRTTWPDERVRAAIDEGYVPLLVDVDLPANAPLAQRFQVSAIPTIVITDARGNQVNRRSAMSADQMASFLESAR